MKAFIVLGLVLLTLAVAASPAGADSIVEYPDGSLSAAFNLGFFGENVFVFWDLAGSGDGDLFIHSTDGSGFLNLITFAGDPGVSFFLDLVGMSGGFFVFDVFASSNGSTYVFVGQFVL